MTYEHSNITSISEIFQVENRLGESYYVDDLEPDIMERYDKVYGCPISKQ